MPCAINLTSKSMVNTSAHLRTTRPSQRRHRAGPVRGSPGDLTAAAHSVWARLSRQYCSCRSCCGSTADPTASTPCSAPPTSCSPGGSLLVRSPSSCDPTIAAILERHSKIGHRLATVGPRTRYSIWQGVALPIRVPSTPSRLAHARLRSISRTSCVSLGPSTCWPPTPVSAHPSTATCKTSPR